MIDITSNPLITLGSVPVCSIPVCSSSASPAPLREPTPKLASLRKGAEDAGLAHAEPQGTQRIMLL